jgi:ATP-dependent Clp protease adaptor protein ClpS
MRARAGAPLDIAPDDATMSMPKRSNFDIQNAMDNKPFVGLFRLTGEEEGRSGFAIRMASRPDGDDGRSPGAAVITRTKSKTKRPSLYRVLLLNDDYTPMEFVVHILMRFFNKSQDAATQVMLHVHHHGVGECGVYTYEIAETKVTQVMDFARKHQHPLQCIMEKK